MRVDVFQVLVLDNEVCRRLLTDGRDARDIVGLVAHQGFHLDKLFRRHLVLPDHVLRVIIVDLRRSAARLRETDPDMGVGKLQKVPVSGEDRHLISLFLLPLCDRSEDIIRLIAFFCEDRDTHGGQDLLHERYLFMKFLWHRFSCSLVGIKHFVAERRGFQVKSHRKVVRFLLIENFK